MHPRNGRRLISSDVSKYENLNSWRGRWENWLPCWQIKASAAAIPCRIRVRFTTAAVVGGSTIQRQLMKMKERESLVLSNSFTFLFVDFAAPQVPIPPHMLVLMGGVYFHPLNEIVTAS